MSLANKWLISSDSTADLVLFTSNYEKRDGGTVGHKNMRHV